MRILGVLSFVVVSWVPSNAFGWGAYGHQAILFEAQNKIKTTEAGRCLMTSRLKAGVPGATSIDGGALVILAIAPDYFWKTVGTAPVSPELKKKRAENNRTEHSYHFFEGNAFAPHGPAPEYSYFPGSISLLPFAGGYMSLVTEYATMLQKNAGMVADIDKEKKLADPSHATAKDVAEHGTAPWRTGQMFRLAVDALKAKGKIRVGGLDYEPIQVAALYLGAMGHYVGDMSQPFHANLDFNGQYPDHVAEGIHSAFETDTLNRYAEKANAGHDTKGRLWAHYNATHNGMISAMSPDISAIAENDIVSSTFKMVDSGFAYADSLMQVFASLLKAHSHSAPTAVPAPGTPVGRMTVQNHAHTNPTGVSAAVIEAFMQAKLDELDDSAKKTGRTLTVVQVAEKRMAKSADLMAQLIVSAFDLAKREYKSENHAELSLDCSSLADLDAEKIEELAILGYKPANYLTAAAQPLE